MTKVEATLLLTEVANQRGFVRALGGIFKNLGMPELGIEKIVEDTAAGEK